MIIPLDHIAKGLNLTIEPVEEGYTCEIRDDAIENGESKYQIGEGQFYDYEFSDSRYGFAKAEPIEYFRKQKHIGRISPNIFVGTLSLEVINIDFNESFGPIEIEVQSVKSGYRNDYRRMLEEITEHCFDLILQMNVPIKQNLISDFGTDNKTDYQRFAFVRSIIDSDSFNEAIQRIISAPVTMWSEHEEFTDLRQVRRLNRSLVKQIVANNNRSELADNHSLRAYGLTSIPQRVIKKTKTDSVDTPENRFVKHVLEVFLHFVMEFERSVKSETRESKESKVLSGKIEEYLSHNIFRSVSRPTSLRLNSPVLQRKEGYREVLRAWVMFDLAAKLIWSGGDDVYKAGKKDIATLYEYWLYFKLLELFSEVFNLESEDVSSLIVQTQDKLGLQLKQGKYVALKGIYEGHNRKLNVRFSYNRSFSGSNDYPKKGSWTKTMRPDYTLSIWPGNIDEDSAEEQELITHVHFDAKYKIENFLKMVDDSDSDTEKEEEAKGKYKNADLLKMHAYRDAIRRTSGAYVLYPGSEVYRREGFHEIIPGLGAFPIKPSINNSGVSVLKSFLLEIIDNLTNRASQKEQSNTKNYLIHRDKPTEGLHEPLPENYGMNREIHPLETTVIIGYYKSTDHLNWIENNHLYNARINSDRGSVSVNKDFAGAKYLLLHGPKELETSRLFEIEKDGTRIFTRDELQKRGYPKPRQDAYMVFKITKADLNDFGNPTWDIRKLENYKSNRDSALPFTENLHSLMKSKI